jgi:hypothetical protein
MIYARDGRALTINCAAIRAQQFNSLKRAFNFIEETPAPQQLCIEGMDSAVTRTSASHQ